MKVLWVDCLCFWCFILKMILLVGFEVVEVEVDDILMV